MAVGGGGCGGAEGVVSCSDVLFFFFWLVLLCVFPVAMVGYGGCVTQAVYEVGF
ncbi:hypothetical protein Hanom_Chr17g01539931 [Helianthus anomalus]